MLKVKGQAATSETGQQPNVEVVPLKHLISFSSFVRCTGFSFFVLFLFLTFAIAFTTGETSSGSLPMIGCFIFFYQFVLVFLRHI